MAKGKAKPAAKSVAKKAAAKKSPAKKAMKKVVAKKVAAVKAAPAKAKAKTPVKAKGKTVTAAAVKKTPLAKPAAGKKTSASVNLRGFITPLDDRLIVRKAEALRQTAGGLFIPDTATTVSGNFEGTVVSVGRGHVNKKGHLQPMALKIGDKVVFPEYAGTPIKLHDQDLLILRETDVLGVVD